MATQECQLTWSISIGWSISVSQKSWNVTFWLTNTNEVSESRQNLEGAKKAINRPTRTDPEPPPAIEFGSAEPPNVLIRIPFWPFTIVMFLTQTCSTISITPAYYWRVVSAGYLVYNGSRLTWPRLPTEIPCDPPHRRFITLTCVAFGLKAWYNCGQSS